MDEQQRFNNPFASLEGLKDRLPAAPAQPAEPAAAPAPAVPPAGKKYARAVVRMERAGRRGKEVTVVEHLDLPARELEKWLKELKAALGCGGVVEERSIVLQGDHRKRLPDILSRRGVKKVTVG